MRISHIHRYLLRQFAPPFFIGTLFFTFIIMIFYLKEVIRVAIEKNLGIWLIFELMFYSLGWSLALTLPMAALLATIMAIGKLNNDSEIIAMRSGGASFWYLFRPFFGLGVVFTIVMLYYCHVVIPYCFYQMATIINTINRSDPSAILTPGQFVSLGQSQNSRQVIYIGSAKKIQKRQKYYNIQIRKITENEGISRLTELIFAQEGEIVQEKKGQQRFLRLFRGYIFSRQEKNFLRLDFSRGFLDINLNFARLARQGINEHDFPAFSYMKLKEAIKRYEGDSAEQSQRYYRKALTELYKRYSLPFASLVFFVLGFPLGISNRRSGKGAGFGISIIYIFLYFALYLMSEQLAANWQFLPPLLAAWLANVVTVAAALYIFYRRSRPY
ncbi:MAG: LptF/LptG family permease [Leptospiraceae bacterium]|nr:LptF/LptG family permease [Leptospiraceae bacterium]MDW8305671.1 LptF/LptG family permease [Leptospiraceae bacterium]